MGKKLKNMKDVIKDLPHRIHDEEVAQIRMHYYTRWAYICNQDKYASEDELKALKYGLGTLGGMIDFHEPHVRIEWLLCDPQYQRAVKKDSTREEFLSLLTDEEREVYLNEGYTELENAKVSKEVGRTIKRKVKDKLKRKEKGEDTIEQV